MPPYAESTWKGKLGGSPMVEGAEGASIASRSGGWGSASVYHSRSGGWGSALAVVGLVLQIAHGPPPSSSTSCNCFPAVAPTTDAGGLYASAGAHPQATSSSAQKPQRADGDVPSHAYGGVGSTPHLAQSQSSTTPSLQVLQQPRKSVKSVIFLSEKVGGCRCSFIFPTARLAFWVNWV